MPDKLLLLISAGQVTAARWQGGQLAESNVFPNDDAGLAAFRQHLETVDNIPVQLMVDAVEEDYRHDTLPHSYGRDRREMLARKLRQFYRNTPYCCALLRGREPGKRRDDRFLFMALTNPELIARWVQAAADRSLPVAGIYLLPMVSETLVQKLQLKTPNLLLVSLHGAGLRLAFFRDQKLRISRLARTDAADPRRLENLFEEITNTRLYLHSLRILTLEEPLTVLVVDRRDELVAATEAILQANPNLDCRRLARAEIVARAQIPTAVLDASSDALYLHLAGGHAPTGNLAPATVTSRYTAYQTRRVLYAAAGLAALAAVAWCAANIYQVFDVREQTKVAALQTAQQQTAYQEATRLFPPAPTNAENIRRAVEISRKLAQTQRTPESLMQRVSLALEANPSIMLRSLAWKHGRTGIDTNIPNTAMPQGQAPTAAGPRRQSGSVEGEVQPFRGDYRAAIEAIDRFAQTIAQDPAIAEVKIVALPLNISSHLSLSGNTVDSRETAPASARFRLSVALKPTP